MKPLKIVIISYGMYPVISARSFRTTELATQLAKSGHDITLYTVWKESSDFYNQFTTNTGVKLKNLGETNFNIGNRLIDKIIMKLTNYPLIKLLPLVKNAIENESTFDYLITIAAPHQIHWGASFADEKSYQCWTADCGDPYMKNPFGFHPFYFKWFEKKWCRSANSITVPIEEAKYGYYKEFWNKIHVIPQGFDLSNVQISDYKPNSIPTFAYAGNLYKKGRDITAFLDFLSTISDDFRFIVYTKNVEIFKMFSSRLKEKMELRGYIPRDSLLSELSKMDFLINIRNDYATQRPSKLIDYYITKRPILEISSRFVEKEVFNEFFSMNFKNKIRTPDMSIYDIENVANAFLKLFTENHELPKYKS